jgi:hypothetical protein
MQIQKTAINAFLIGKIGVFVNVKKAICAQPKRVFDAEKYP